MTIPTWPEDTPMADSHYGTVSHFMKTLTDWITGNVVQKATTAYVVTPPASALRTLDATDSQVSAVTCAAVLATLLADLTTAGILAAAPPEE